VKGKMNFREHTILGRTGLKVSRLGAASGYGVPYDAVEKAFHEYGVNYFFWSSPRRQGLKEAVQHLVRSERDKMVIALQTYDHQGLFMRHFVEKGLRDLNIDYADVLILGWFNYIPRGRVIETALKLKEEGKVRFVGMSGHKRTVFGQMAVQVDNPIDIFMVRYNAVHRGAETDIFPFLSGQGRPGVITYTTTCWSKLLKADKMPAGEPPLTSTDCYRFALSNPNVNMCLTGPKNQKEMDEALLTLDSTPLSTDEMERIRRIGDFIHGKRFT
jgi:aryl-alcohol dehydrogenase-like predicted oxidoreductase